MEIINCEKLCKAYKRFDKEAGLKGSIKSLFKREYTEKRAVNDFDLKVDAGEFVGLIGPNGAGKTTLIKLLTGIIRKTSGELNVLGYDPNRLEDAFKRRYAVVMGQKSQLFSELTAADTFLLFKELYSIPEADFKRNRDMLVDMLGVGELLNVQVRTLSLGERMKLELICALLHNPGVLFLDEPTIGLDAVAQKQIRAFLRSVNSECGTTILLTSHYMEDIRSLCRRCVVMKNGQKVYDGDMNTLFERYQTLRKVTVTYSTHVTEAPSMDAREIAREGERVTYLLPKQSTRDALIGMLNKYDVSDITIGEEDIGDVVERIYAGEVRS